MEIPSNQVSLLVMPNCSFTHYIYIGDKLHVQNILNTHDWSTKDNNVQRHLAKKLVI